MKNTTLLILFFFHAIPSVNKVMLSLLKVIYPRELNQVIKAKLKSGEKVSIIHKTDAIGSSKRIGVLDTKTNNVNDLVIECGKVLQWNGYNYEEK